MAQQTKDLDTITNQKLSIQISLSGLSFCVLNANSNTVSSIEHIKFNKKANPFEALERLIHFFDTKPYLQDKFDDILVIHENDLSTLVPKPLFNKDYLADYLKFNSKILKSDYLSYDVLNNDESVNVYVPYVNINNYIYEAFGEFTFKHFSTILIEEVLKNETDSKSNKVYVHVCEQHFEIVAVDNGALILYNTFEYSNAEDFIYYILFTLEQLNYDPDNIDIVLIGNISEEGALYKMAYKYIRNITFGTIGQQIVEDSEANHSNYIIVNSF
ncbi:DUF3822 family protein [Hyunsoonleella flava]|uniref:DUF3822 family protein n=1 Tax=Hyunsoonleella flava TaxID=2527939 RepID=A0A4Q9FAY6_9FLAO|nr:DUF3822 family protein [Hyunsoonleella flava]TBN00465.1 DUF3822 family protein [Hyunsoonleella flava]